MDGSPGELPYPPKSYLPPAMQYFHPQQQQHTPPDPYRASPQQHEHPQASPTPLLPPIHHYEAQQQQQQQQQQQAPQPQQQMMHAPPHYQPAALNAPLPLPPSQQHHLSHYPPQSYAPPPPQQYAPNNLPPAPMAANGQNGGMLRYPIPPQSTMQMGMARPKKDIKRRTKTGCQTCRKRRIKCDEGHPTCRNCQKSKRECLGYDPIFKQQPAPALIAPASAASGLESESPSQPSPHQQSAYRPTSTYATALPGFPHGGDSPQALDSRGEYVDPALAEGEQSLTMAANSFRTTLQAARKAKLVDMEQLFCINNVEPRYQRRDAPPPNSNTLVQEVEEFYNFHFAPGLDKLFETTWFGDRGAQQIRRQPSLLDFAMQVMEQMKSPNEDALAFQNLQSLESRLVWQFALLPRLATVAHGANNLINDPLTSEVLARVDTLEHLLLGSYLPPQKIPLQPSPDHQSSNPKFNQCSFWHQLGRFTSARDDSADPNAYREINDSLGAMRGILGMLENRDVLYSLAIVRHIGGRLVEFQPPRQIVPLTDDPNDDVKKLQVAQLFVTQEEHKGTTQAIQRVCGMAMRSWMLQNQ